LLFFCFKWISKKKYKESSVAQQPFTCAEIVHVAGKVFHTERFVGALWLQVVDVARLLAIIAGSVCHWQGNTNKERGGEIDEFNRS
jgi:hypothetical protein